MYLNLTGKTFKTGSPTY